MRYRLFIILFRSILLMPTTIAEFRHSIGPAILEIVNLLKDSEKFVRQASADALSQFLEQVVPIYLFFGTTLNQHAYKMSSLSSFSVLIQIFILSLSVLGFFPIHAFNEVCLQ